MKKSWWPIIIGYLVGSFFGVFNLLQLVKGIFGGARTAKAA